MRTKLAWLVTGLIGALLLFSASGKLLAPSEEVIKSLELIGFDLGLLKYLGALELLIAVLYLIPRTSFIGAILVTGYMGGAIFAHLRVGDAFFVQALVPVLAWLGLGLRRYTEMKALMTGGPGSAS